MRKPTFSICENKGEDQLQVTAKLTDAFVFATRIVVPLLSKSKISSFCACKAWFVLDLFGNHIVGILMTHLNINWQTRQFFSPITIGLC